MVENEFIDQILFIKVVSRSKSEGESSESGSGKKIRFLIVGYIQSSQCCNIFKENWTWIGKTENHGFYSVGKNSLRTQFWVQYGILLPGTLKNSDIIVIANELLLNLIIVAMNKWLALAGLNCNWGVGLSNRKGLITVPDKEDRNCWCCHCNIMWA
jgi:hypothetical protein